MEGGYCSDTKFADTKFEDKLAETLKHERLIELLKFYVYDVWLGPMPLGYASTIYTNNLSVLPEFGLNRSAAKTVLQRLHMHAISCLHNIVKARRYLERNGIEGWHQYCWP